MNRNIIKYKDALIAFTIIVVTTLLIYLLPLTGYLREPTSDSIVGFQIPFILTFLAFDLIWIGIPAWIHWIYVKDYSKVKNIWFFAIWGGVTGALLGEIAMGRSPFLIISYTILMLIYGYFYKKFPWWQVALTSYLGGMLVENVMNRSPMQLPTLIWIGFFTAPYFVTKIFENRHKISLKNILFELRYTILASIFLGNAAVYLTRNNTSPPVIVAGFALPFLITIIKRTAKRLRS